MDSDPHAICRTAHWRISHRKDSRYRGYLIISSLKNKAELYELGEESLRELGAVLGDTERLLRSIYRPLKVIFYKLGFSSGFNIHFHAAPVSHNLLSEIEAHPDYADDPDGNDAILFLSRIYCERDLSAGESDRIALEISRLRHAASDWFRTKPSSQGEVPA